VNLRRARSVVSRSVAAVRPRRLSKERVLGVHYAIARAFADAETLDDVADLLLETLVHSLVWKSGALWVASAGGSTLRCSAVYPRDGALEGWAAHVSALELAEGVGLPGRVWKTGTSSWISDTEIDDNFPRQALAREVGLRHAFAFPIQVGGSTVAVIELLAARIREVDPDQVEFLTAVGHQLGSFLRRIEARRTVVVSEARKAAVLAAAVDAIVSADDTGRILDFNAAAEVMFGRQREDVIGRRIGDLIVPPELREQHETSLARYIDTGESRILGRRVRTWGLRSDGTRLAVELTITEAALDGRPMFTAFIRDISRERQAETARDRFLEILSHELRTPVTSIYGFSKLALRPALSPTSRDELLADISSEADQLFRMVEDLIVLARAERGGTAIALEPVSLDRVVDRAVAAISTRWPGLEFRVTTNSLGAVILAEETYLEQLLRNILTNAGKYASAGGLVEILIEHDPAEARVRILDRGPGIDPAEIQSLFEIDYRSPSTEALAQGSGIGLFVAKWLAEAMGGRIWASRRDEGGSEFGFALPVLDDAATEHRGPGDELVDEEPLVIGAEGSL